ncbi:hypothetical protein [Agromyces sp. GXS1127]
MARANLERADVADRVEIIVGRAADTLPHLAERLAEHGHGDDDDPATASN